MSSNCILGLYPLHHPAEAPKYEKSSRLFFIFLQYSNSLSLVFSSCLDYSRFLIVSDSLSLNRFLLSGLLMIEITSLIIDSYFSYCSISLLHFCNAFVLPARSSYTFLEFCSMSACFLKNFNFSKSWSSLILVFSNFFTYFINSSFYPWTSLGGLGWSSKSGFGLGFGYGFGFGSPLGNFSMCLIQT